LAQLDLAMNPNLPTHLPLRCYSTLGDFDLAQKLDVEALAHVVVVVAVHDALAPFEVEHYYDMQIVDFEHINVNVVAVDEEDEVDEAEDVEDEAANQQHLFQYHLSLLHDSLDTFHDHEMANHFALQNQFFLNNQK
jgi:hypothetical protein